MPLTKEQETIAREHYEKFVKKCPVCGSKSYAFGEIIRNDQADMPYQEPYGTISPSIQVICNTCFNILEFSANPILDNKSNLGF